jgi:DNA polymerase-3 subunit delta
LKIAYRQLAGQLKSGLARVYLVAGDEPLLVEEALDAVRASARNEGYAERELHVVDRGFKWADLETQVDNFSLFASRKLVELRLMSARLGDAGSKAARSLIETTDEDRLLLIGIHSKLDSATARLAWVKAAEKCGVRVEVWPVERGELPRWVSERARRHGIHLERAAVELLAERAEGNLLAVDQELAKLALLDPRGRYDEQSLAAAVGDNARFDVFGLTDALLAGDGRRAIRVLGGLRSEGVAPPLIAWALAREIGLLASVRFALDDGVEPQNAMRNNGIWPRRQPLVSAALRRLSREKLIELVRFAAGVDRACKGADRGLGPWEAITSFIVMAATGKPEKDMRHA